jgi:hypothetical protein
VRGEIKRFGQPPNGARQRRALADTPLVLERGKRAIEPRQYFLFSENFKQVIETGSYVAAGHGQTSGMHYRAEFDAEL